MKCFEVCPGRVLKAFAPMVQVKSHLRGGSAPFSASQLDALLAANAARSRELAAAERDTQAFWIAEYFRQRTAADPNATWRAQLISWGSQDAGASTSLLA